MKARLLSLLLIGGAVAGLGLLVADRESSGDTYAAGSSLRTDRSGASVLYEALAAKGAEVSRSYQQPVNLQLRDSTYVLLNLRPNVAEEEDYRAFERMAREGNRIIAALDAPTFRFFADPRYKGPPLGLKEWGIAIRSAPARADDDDDDNDEKQEKSRWPLWFEAGKEWRNGLEDDGHMIAIERHYGRGSIVFVAASASFLNGSLRDERDSALLNWTVNDSSRFVFDELHLGASEGGSIMGLIRRLHLTGILAALLTAALLFYWQSSVPFPPPAPEAMGDFTLPADGAGAILVNLLERRIAPAQLASQCLACWVRDCGRRAGSGRVEEVQRIAARRAPITDLWEEIRGVLKGAVRGIRTE